MSKLLYKSSIALSGIPLGHQVIRGGRGKEGVEYKGGHPLKHACTGAFWEEFWIHVLEFELKCRTSVDNFNARLGGRRSPMQRYLIALIRIVIRLMKQ